MTKNRWREDFPAVKGHEEIIFFDNAATTQKVASAIDCMTTLWQNGVTAVGRSSGKLAREQSELLERAQTKVARFFGAQTEELIIAASATQALNVVVENLTKLVAEDEKIVLSVANHHSNIAPWIKWKKAAVTWLGLNEDGKIDQKALKQLLGNEKVRVVSLTLVSNVLGVKENLTQIEEMIEKANQERERKIFLVVDAAAAMIEEKINWRKIRADVMIVSGHKMYGPAIAGVLVKQDLLLSGDFAPVFYGGGMLKSLNLAKEIVLAASQEQRWRPGVSDVVGLVGWAAACEWLETDWQEKEMYLRQLTKKLVSGLSEINGIKLLGAPNKGHLVSFVYSPFASVDVMAYLTSKNILAREGLHCCQPLHETLGYQSSIRLSLAHYNTEEEVERVLKLLRRVPDFLWQPMV